MEIKNLTQNMKDNFSQSLRITINGSRRAKRQSHRSTPLLGPWKRASEIIMTLATSKERVISTGGGIRSVALIHNSGIL